MTDIAIGSLLDSLGAHASHLNDASDDANRLLESIEDRIVKMNIGLEVWYRYPILREDATGDFGPSSISQQVVQLFGFAKVEGKWCLAVKPMRLVKGFYEGQMDQAYEQPFAAGAPTPLLKASRLHRLAAVDVLAPFLEQLGEHVQSVVKSIDGAAQSVPKRPRRVEETGI